MKKRYKDIVDAQRRNSTGVDSDTKDFHLDLRWFAELQNVVLSIKSVLTQAGLNWEYFNEHSFRVETAKSANQAVAESTMKVWDNGRAWPIKDIYIRPADPALASVSKKMTGV